MRTQEQNRKKKETITLKLTRTRQGTIIPLAIIQARDCLRIDPGVGHSEGAASHGWASGTREGEGRLAQGWARAGVQAGLAGGAAIHLSICLLFKEKTEGLKENGILIWCRVKAGLALKSRLLADTAVHMGICDTASSW